MEVGSRVRITPFKVPTGIGHTRTNDYAGRVGTVLQIGDAEKGSLAVKVELDGDTDFYYWFPLGVLCEATERPTKKRKKDIPA